MTGDDGAGRLPDEGAFKQAELTEGAEPDLLDSLAKTPELPRKPEPVPLFPGYSADSLFEQHLQRIWETMHGRYPTTDGDDSHAWRVVRGALFQIRGVELIGQIIRSSPSYGRVDAEPLPADPLTMPMLVATAVEQIPPGQLVDFLEQRLIATVVRLEQDGVATREQIADTLIAALNPLRGEPVTAGLLTALCGYVLREEARADSAGFYLTIAQIGQMLSSLGLPETRRQGAIAYHTALRGIWSGLTDDTLTFDAPVQSTVSQLTSNLGMLLWRMVTPPGRPSPRKSPGEVLDSPGVLVVRTLRSIAAVTSRGPTGIDDKLRRDLVAALGIEGYAPELLLAVLENIGPLAQSWEPDLLRVAWLEAVGGVVAAAAGDEETVAPRLYNAAVTLRWPAESGAAQYIRTRIALNALGVRFALMHIHQDDLADTLGERDAIDSATSMFTDAVNLRDSGNADPSLWNAIARVAALLGGLSASQESGELLVMLARLQQATKPFQVQASAQVELWELTTALDRLLAELSPGWRKSTSLEHDELVIAGAKLLRRQFDALIGDTEWSLPGWIDDLVEARRDPRDAFVQRYRQFVGLPGGPLAAAGVDSAADWRAWEEELRRDPGTMVPYLMDLVAQLRAARSG